MAHLFKYDTLMGTFPGTVTVLDDQLIIDGLSIALIQQREVTNIDWKLHDIDWVIEATGHYTQREKADQHLKSGAKNVLISAPAQDEDCTIVMGVNDNLFDPHCHHIVSPGSCTSNALAPLVKVIQDTFGIKYAFFSTVHAYTPTQALLDDNRSDLRRSRAAALNIVPTSTGAAEVIGKVIPGVGELMSGYALRVPVSKVSFIDFMFVAQKPITAEAIHHAFTQAAQGSMKGILALTFEPLVSSDFNGNEMSVTIDGLLTQVMGNTARVTGWYDNEWGYCCRIKDFLLKTLNH